MINFYIISRNRIIFRIFQLLIKLIPKNSIVYIIQGRLKGKKWIIGSGQHMLWLGSYEYRKQILFSKTIRESAVVYDIGAHVGFYTLLASVLVGSKGRVFAFEPSPRNACYLKKHLRLNYCNNVTVIEAAVTDKDDTVSFEEGFTSYDDHLSTEGSLEIKTFSLDSLVSKGRIPPPDYIKIDIEGVEWLALSGAKEILVKYSPTIFLSTHGFDWHNQCCAFLKSIGYDLQTIEESELLAFNKSKRCAE